MSGFPWGDAEEKELVKYFNTRILLPTLYTRIHNINPKRTYEAVGRKVRRWQAMGWVKVGVKALEDLRVGYLDIEATHLNADFGFILSWYIKARGKRYFDYSVITKKEIFNEEFDRRLILELMKAFKNYDVIYTHWGADRRFDIPYIRTRAYAHGLQHLLPKKFEIFLMDTWPIARNKLKLHNNRLDSIAEAVGVKGVKKTPLSGKTWVLASVGNKKKLEYVLEHNRHDVIMLERIHKKLKPIERPIYRSI
jgi:uncharacterized protein YprB with RNaseH-like and TPR domain